MKTFLSLFFVLSFACLLVLAQFHSVAAGGCVAQQSSIAVYAAANSIRYHNYRATPELIEDALSIARENGEPRRFIRRILLAKRYWRLKKFALAEYHLFHAALNPCW